MKTLIKVEVVDEELECGCTAHIEYGRPDISYGKCFTARINVVHCSECGEIFDLE